MGMITTCPACDTTFKVTTEQLNAHQGDVRCGRCAKVFSAFDSLAPVADKHLTTLVLDRCPITDLSPVRHQPIRTLSLSDLALTDLTPLSAMPLEDVQLAKLTLEDWSVLKGKPLRIFTAREMVLRDVEFLRGTPLTDFQVSKLGRPLDVSPLADCPQLRDVVLDPQCTGLEKLRHVTTIARISIRDEPSGAPAQPAAEFWAAYDAQQAAGKK